MPDCIRVELGWPPTLNHYYAVRNGRKVKSARGRAYAEHAAFDARMQHDGDPLAVPVSVTVEAAPPDNRRRDLDNLCKPILDAMSGVLWLDDFQVHELIVRRGAKLNGGAINLTVRPI
jgi:crossover junction endodeoxyribonuclease RusA